MVVVVLVVGEWRRKERASKRKVEGAGSLLLVLVVVSVGPQYCIQYAVGCRCRCSRQVQVVGGVVWVAPSCFQGCACYSAEKGGRYLLRRTAENKPSKPVQ